jgi:hypothetical protein
MITEWGLVKDVLIFLYRNGIKMYDTKYKPDVSLKINAG